MDHRWDDHMRQERETRGDRERFVVARRAGDETLVKEIQDLVRSNLSAHEYPRQVVFVDELPKTPAGKVHRKALRDRELAAIAEGAGAASQLSTSH